MAGSCSTRLGGSRSTALSTTRALSRSRSSCRWRADGQLGIEPGEGEQPPEDVLRETVLEKVQPIVGGGLRFTAGVVVHDGGAELMHVLDEEGAFEVNEQHD